MAAGAWIRFDNFLQEAWKGATNLEGTMVCALLANAHTPAPTTDSTWSDVSADEISDGDYAPVVLTSKVISNPAAEAVRFDCADLDFGDPVTISARYAVLVFRAGGALAGTDVLVAYADLNTGGSEVSSTTGLFKITIGALGVFNDS